MRVLIVSDSHGRNDYVKQAMQQTGTFDAFIHLGDVGADAEELKTFAACPSYIVAGNNDVGSGLPATLTVTLGGKKIFLTHGHRYGGDYDVRRLGLLGTMNHMDMVMFGHTHYPYLDRSEELMMLNPGSLTYPRQEGRARTFMVMEIHPEGNVDFFWQELEEEGKRKKKSWLDRIFEEP